MYCITVYWVKIIVNPVHITNNAKMLMTEVF